MIIIHQSHCTLPQVITSAIAIHKSKTRSIFVKLAYLCSDSADELLFIVPFVVDRGVGRESLLHIAEGGLDFFVLSFGDDSGVEQKNVVHFEQNRPDFEEVAVTYVNFENLFEVFEFILFELLAFFIEI